jgi:hypothetical protein
VDAGPVSIDESGQACVHSVYERQACERKCPENVMVIHILDTDKCPLSGATVRSNCGQEGRVNLSALDYTPDDQLCADCLEERKNFDLEDRLVSVAVV